MADGTQDEAEPHIRMLREVPMRPISHNRHMSEINTIYAGLWKEEAKSIHTDQELLRRNQNNMLRWETLSSKQWRLIALHERLLNMHCDFFQASKSHPARGKLFQLDIIRSMPARIWRHGIRAFMEVLRHRMPESLEHMLTFFYFTISIIALLYEYVLRFEDTRIECLGDLGRYKMAIEENESEDRKIWSKIARYWYSKKLDKEPTLGRLYYHLAITARPGTLEQLSLFTRSVSCVTPFESARESIIRWLNPMLSRQEGGHYQSFPMESLLINAHSLLFLFPKSNIQELEVFLEHIKDRRRITKFVQKNGSTFKYKGVFLGISNIAALFEFGALSTKGAYRSILRRALDAKALRINQRAISGELVPPPPLTEEETKSSVAVLSYASDLTFSIFELVLDLEERIHILPMVHITLYLRLRLVYLPDR